MADKKDKPEPAEVSAPKQEDGSSKAGLDADDDLMDLFTEEDQVNEELALLAGVLDDVPMSDLLVQLRDVRSILDQRKL